MMFKFLFLQTILSNIRRNRLRKSARYEYAATRFFFLNRQISTISQFMAWNGFPVNFRCAILRKLKSKHNSNDPAPYSNTSSENNSNNIADENISKIWVRIPFLGKQGEYLVKKLIRKLQHNLTKPVKFIVIYQTKKSLIFCPKRTKFLTQSEII